MTDSLYCSLNEINLEPNPNFYENDLNYGSMVRVLELKSVVGIESLSDQYLKRAIRYQKFHLNIMLLGQTGIGKSTLIDSLFKTKFSDHSSQSHSFSEVDVICHYYDLKEKDIDLKLGIIESKGFGDQINKEQSYKPIVEYIDRQFDDYLEQELRTERTPHRKDTRIDICFYLISPVGQGLKAIDLVTMEKLHTKVNLIPVIAKSDVITKPELTELKAKIRSEIESNGISIYRFPTEETEDSFNSLNDDILPFAVIASNEFVLIGNNKVRARKYPWGIVEVENEKHCDLKLMREMVLRKHLNDFKETTHYRHYEHYRSQRLEELWKERQFEHLTQLKAREKELIYNFTAKLKAKELELKNTEKELHQRFERLSRERLEEKMRLDLGRQRLDEDIRALNTRKQLHFGQKPGGKDSADSKQPSTPKTTKK